MTLFSIITLVNSKTINITYWKLPKASASVWFGYYEITPINGELYSRSPVPRKLRMHKAFSYLHYNT